MRKERVVCVDVDGVLLSLLGALETTLYKRGYFFNPNKVTNYQFKCSCGCPRNVILECFQHVELYLNEEPLDEAEPALAKLQNYAITQGYTCTRVPEVYEQRAAYMNSVGLYGLPYGGGGFVKPVLEGIDAVFEDSVDSLNNWVEAGSSARLYLIDAPYNKKPHAKGRAKVWDHVIRCKSFADAVNKYIAYVEDEERKGC